MEEIITMISNQGFSIVMCAYVMVTMNKSMNELTKAITILNEKLDKGDK